MSDIEKTITNDAAPRPDVAAADEALLASLGYKQEFRREFTGLEVRICVACSLSLFFTALHCFTADIWHCIQYHRSPAVYRVSTIVDIFITAAKMLRYSSVLFYSMPNGGPAAMVWGVRISPHARF